MSSTLLQFKERHPFILVLLALLFGIIPGIYWHIQVPIYFILVFSSVVLIGIILYSVHIIKHLFVYLLLFTIIIGGFIITRQLDTVHDSNGIINILPKASYLLGYVNDDVSIKNNKAHTELIIKGFLDNKKCVHNTNGSLLLISPLNKRLVYGKLVLIKSSCVQCQLNLGNPFEFDYTGFLNNKHIAGIAFPKSNDIIFINEARGNIFKKEIISINKYTTGSLGKFIKDKEVLGLIEALLLGIKTKVSDDTIKAYTDCGVIHIMAVSGTQVVLIYLLIQWIFKLLPTNLHQQTIKWIISLSVIWIFAAMAGFSGSVVRAAVMFTFITFAPLMHRTSSIYNMMAASLFFILLFDPYSITDVGLQLSYVAVWGIITIYPYLYKLIKVPNPLLKILWQSASVSIAAQISTLPLVLLYFNRLPTYFLPANLIAIPLTTICLYLGIIIIAFGNILPSLAQFSAICIQFLFHLLNHVLNYLQLLPGSIIYTESWAIFSFFMMLLFTGSSVYFLIYRNRKSIIIALSSLIVIYTLSDLKKINNYHKYTIVQLKSNRHKNLFLIREGHYAVLMYDTTQNRNSYFNNIYLPHFCRMNDIYSLVLIRPKKNTK